MSNVFKNLSKLNKKSHVFILKIVTYWLFSIIFIVLMESLFLGLLVGPFNFSIFSCIKLDDGSSSESGDNTIEPQYLPINNKISDGFKDHYSVFDLKLQDWKIASYKSPFNYWDTDSKLKYSIEGLQNVIDLFDVNSVKSKIFTESVIRHNSKIYSSYIQEINNLKKEFFELRTKYDSSLHAEFLIAKAEQYLAKMPDKFPQLQEKYANELDKIREMTASHVLPSEELRDLRIKIGKSIWKLERSMKLMNESTILIKLKENS